uniref:Reverse transcriptase domain-containing protein n=1 Tax=Tanacetum cinerariifolium TaxID=118510 RepID=A0A699GU08_TANCI|nr:hypothetical protein [Tanacetum cinerariifolium]
MSTLVVDSGNLDEDGADLAKHPSMVPTTTDENGLDVAISMESVRVVHERLSNIVYGFLFSKRAAYSVVENCVKNTWIKYGLVKSMMTIKCDGYTISNIRESVGTFTARVILFGMIPTDIPAIIPVVDPPFVSTLPHTSPFMYTNSSDSNTSKMPPSQDPYKVSIARWRILVEARSSPSSLPTHDSPPTLPQILPAPPGLPLSERPSHSSSAGPSRKRCRSPSDSVSSAAPVPRALFPVHANLLPPRKKVRSFVSVTDCEASSDKNYKPYTEPDIDYDIQADIDASIAAADAMVARETDVRVETKDKADEEAESSARGTVKIEVNRVTHPVVSDDIAEPVREDFSELVSTDGSLESVAMSERIGTLERDNMRLRGIIMTITRSGITPEAIEELIFRCVEEALAAQEANSNARLIDENQSQNGDDNDNKSEGNGNHGNNNGNGNQNGGDGCAKINAPVDKNFGIHEAYEMPWKDLMKLMIEVYCPRNEIMKLENEMVPEENDKIKRFIWGLPDNIQCNVTSSKPDRLQDSIRMANGLMDQKVGVYAARNAEQNRKFEQPPFKRKNVAQAVLVGNSKKKGYAGSAPYYNKCRFYHEGPCTVKCISYNKVGHMARDYKIVVATQTPRALVTNQRDVNRFGCGSQGHYKSDCPKLKNQNRRNKAANNDAHVRAYALGGGDANPDSNVVTGVFLLNNHDAYILFDSGADRSFVSITFSALIDIPPTALDVSYTFNAVIVGLLHEVLPLPRQST